MRLRELKRQPGSGIWLCGGAELAAAILPEIDELILKVNPVLFGAGIPLIAGSVALPLTLLSTHAYTNGVLLQQYRIGR